MEMTFGALGRCALCAFTAGSIAAQQIPGALAFEVASVKSAAIGVPRRELTDQSVTMTRVTLRELLTRAYALQNYQVRGPDWQASEFYDVFAKLPQHTTKGQIPEMLQTFLAERFRLKFHWETQALPARVLEVAKQGFRLKLANPASTFPTTATIGSEIQWKGRTTVSQLALLLSALTREPVLDRTGIQGEYDVDLRWTREQRASDGSAAAAAETDPLDVPDVPAETLEDCLQRKLGLRLEVKKVPLKVMVVERVEKAPISN